MIVHRPRLAVLSLSLFAACNGSDTQSGGPADPGGPEPFEPRFAAVELAEPDADLAPAGAAAPLSIHGLASDFEFQAGAVLAEDADGGALLIGSLASQGDPQLRFELELRLSGRVLPGDEVYDECVPVKGLFESAYVESGGEIDTDTWGYYAQASGKLVGRGALQGARLEISAAEGPALQCGDGASGRNGDYGLCAALSTRTLKQPLAGPTLEEDAQPLTLAASLLPESSLAILPAEKDPLFGESGGGHTLWLPGIGTDFVFVGGGTLNQHADGSAHILGLAASRSAPSRQFLVRAELQGRVQPGDASHPPAGSPKLELDPTAYLSGGGTIDPKTWIYFEELQGELVGVADLEGARLAIERTGPSFQLGFGANGKNLRYGASSWIALTVLDQPLAGDPLPAFPSDGDFNFDLGRRALACVDEGAEDPLWSTLPGGFVLWLPELGKDFRMQAGGSFLETSNGTATLRGIVERDSDPLARFEVELHFARRVNPGAADYPPPGSPKQDLIPAAYVENGGPIDTGAWHYYLATFGTLRGIDGYLGALLSVKGHGPAFQVGLGASGVNLDYGASGWITTHVQNQPLGGPAFPVDMEGDVNFNTRRDCPWCPDEALADAAWGGGGGGHAFTFPGIAGDLVFEPGASFVPHADGSATLSGRLVRKSSPTKRLDVVVTLTGRVEPGDGNHPPAGSPKLELDDHAYVDNGGPIDTGTWHYYETTDGLLTGLDDWAGAQIHISRMGPAFQVGLGASGKNTAYGASGWLDVQVLQQPISGSPLVPTGHGDINIDLFDCP